MKNISKERKESRQSPASTSQYRSNSIKLDTKRGGSSIIAAPIVATQQKCRVGQFHFGDTYKWLWLHSIAFFSLWLYLSLNGQTLESNMNGWLITHHQTVGEFPLGTVVENSWWLRLIAEQVSFNRTMCYLQYYPEMLSYGTQVNLA